jgi:hypothetical protein
MPYARLVKTLLYVLLAATAGAMTWFGQRGRS